MMQDQTGFIWFGTDQGLFRFDGISKKRFTTSDSLADNHITALSQDSLGRIWIGHKNGKISILLKDHIEQFNPPEGSAIGEVSDILFDNKGILWFSTINDGLYYYMDDRLYRLDDIDGMPDLYIYDIEEDGNGNIWAGTDGGIAICKRTGRDVNIDVLDYQNGLPDNIVKRLCRAKNKMMWIATEDTGVLSVNTQTKVVTPLIREWKYGTVRSFIATEDKVWIITNTGLMVYHLAHEHWKTYPNETISIGRLETLMQDREGNLWLGSNTGVSKAFSDIVEFINPGGDKSVLAVASDKAGNIWYATSEGLFRIEVNQSGTAKTTQPLSGGPHSKKIIISLYADSGGFIWAGLYGGGLLRINSQTGNVRHFLKELRNGNVLHITGRGDDIWLATLGGAVKISAKDENLQITNFTSQQGLASDYIYQVFIDSRQRVWFATDRAGVDMMDSKGFHHFGELNFKVVYGFSEDGNKTLWANVQGDGLYYFDQSGFVLAGDSLHLRDQNINAFTSDYSGKLVMVHDYGIDWLNVENKTVQYLGEDAGLNDHRPNLNAISTDNFGRILIGTENGIVIFTIPDESFQSAPKPIITGIRIFDRPVDFDGLLSFRYNQNNITFNYHAFWYQSPENLTYFYKLADHDLEWISTRDRLVTYSSLPSGVYDFHVRVSSTGNFNDAVEVSIPFEIQTPFWQTAWFYIGAMITAGFLVYTIIRSRERKLKSDKQLLEKKVAERTYEIQKKNEEIQAQAEEINSMNENLEKLVEQRTAELGQKNKALEEYAFITAHKLRSPVATLLGLIYLCEKVELPEDDKVIIQHIKESTEKLDTIVRSITRAIEKGDNGS